MGSPPAAPRPDLYLVHSGVPEEPVPVDLEDAFRRFGPVVAKVGLRILGRPHEVDDLVQDVFLEVRRWLGRIRSPLAFRAWLNTVTVRAARSRLRRRRLGQFFGYDTSFDYADVVDDRASAFHRTFISQLYRVLDGLPVNQRIAWMLRYVEGESLARVAEMCACSLSTVKRRIADAHHVILEAFGD